MTNLKASLLTHTANTVAHLLQLVTSTTRLSGLIGCRAVRRPEPVPAERRRLPLRRDVPALQAAPHPRRRRLHRRRQADQPNAASDLDRLCQDRKSDPGPQRGSLEKVSSISPIVILLLKVHRLLYSIQSTQFTGID